MLGSQAGPGGPSQRGIWPLVPAPASSGNNFTADGFTKCGVYSLFPGGPSFGNALYSQARSSVQLQSSGNSFCSKDSLVSATGYTFGAPTPPPCSPYSPVSVTQLELLTKGFNPNIIMQKQQEFSPKKLQLQEHNCEKKCCLTLEKLCNCELVSSLSSVNKRENNDSTGCSRTNPIEWNCSNVKKEPGSTPCQVAEITTSASPVVKLEVTSPNIFNDVQHNVISNSGISSNVESIPLRISVAKQVTGRWSEVTESHSPSACFTTVNGGSAQIQNVARIESRTTGMSTNAIGGTALLQCPNERSGGLSTWSMEGSHNSTLATSSLWQYPASVPMEPMSPFPIPMPPLGYQLVRDPSTGGLLLLPTTGLDSLQQAVVWPNYHQHPVLLPSLPPPSLQILTSSSNYLSNSATLHHTHNSTRLMAVATDNKRKVPLSIPAATIIKVETDAPSLNQAKSLQAMSAMSSNTGTVFPDPNMHPLVTTHLIYQHPTNLILSQPNSEIMLQSQAPSPVSCLTPPPEVVLIEEDKPLAVQDASNQTDTLFSIDDDITNTVTEQMHETRILEPEKIIVNPKESKNLLDQHPDISGLELLSNSIVEFEICKTNDKTNFIEKTIEAATDAQPLVEDNIGGLDLLCALAEQRIMEEKIEKHTFQRVRFEELKKQKRKLWEPCDDKLTLMQTKGDCPESTRSKCEEEISQRLYKSSKSQEEVHKFIASKSQHSCKEEWPCMNKMELEMRIKLADLQRQYREKQVELSLLKPKKHPPDCIKNEHKKSTHPERIETTPQPEKDFVTSQKKQDLLKLPTISIVDNTIAPKQEAIKQSDRIINDYRNDLIRQQALEEFESAENNSSKKRKVGRPKKVLSSRGVHDTTETIVAKKSKHNFVGYLLAANENLQRQNKLCTHKRPRCQDELSLTSHPKKHTITEKSCKIKPKLKAEAIGKILEDHYMVDAETKSGENYVRSKSDSNVIKILNKANDEITNSEEVVDSMCTISNKLLEVDKLRVLTAMGGLFYAGHLNAVEPPDVYSITLDGERGNRPHIMSREEILRDAIVEISPKSTQELASGTRLCAYWSQQYRCLYPGSVAEPGTPNPDLDLKFVAVEFDDGDSGRIALDDIRLLPPNYPIIEYDPNPLLSLSKRRRRNSTTTKEYMVSLDYTKKNGLDVEKENKDINKPIIQSHKERKRLKKKKRDKLKQKLTDKEKKKKKKHKCPTQFCKHRKHHKKCRKHKKHHQLLPRYEIVNNNQEEDLEVISQLQEVTMEDIETTNKFKKFRDRQESSESRSKMSAFLPAGQFWGWSGKGYKRPRAKGRSRKQFFKTIQRGNESITVGDAAVFLSTGRPDRPYIGKIESMWESCGTMVVKVKWFYHPEETVGCPKLHYPGALFESPHVDENDIQTISHKCEVLPLNKYKDRLGDNPERYATIYDNNDIYYLAGYYDPTVNILKMEPKIPLD